MSDTNHPTITVTDDATANADEIGTLLRKLATGPQQERMAVAFATLLEVPQRIADEVQEGHDDRAETIARELTPHLISLLGCMEPPAAERIPVDLVVLHDAEGNYGVQVRPVGTRHVLGEIWTEDDMTHRVYVADGAGEMNLLGRADTTDDACRLGGWVQP